MNVIVSLVAEIAGQGAILRRARKGDREAAAELARRGGR